jgi:glycosyltransferase involved in cell wall biosynthesis
MKSPLVTIAIPTYNRPEGLHRTLEEVTNQSYTNLEILVSDNASPDPQVQSVIRKFASRDIRIQPFLQAENIGAGRNFRFVLKASTGDFFMWASDDDHHSADFVERCIKKFDTQGDAVGTVMTKASVHNRFTGVVSDLVLSDFSNSSSLFRKLRMHLQSPVPTFIYGLHRRDAIRWFEDSESYDWLDCFFVTRLLLSGYDIGVIHDCVGYAAGIDTQEYTPKPMKARNHALFEYMPYARATISEIIRSKTLRFHEKVALSSVVAEFTMRNFSHWERQKRPIQSRAAKVFLLPPAKIFRQAINSCCY